MDGVLLGCAKAGLVSFWLALDIEARERREERRARLFIPFAFAEHEINVIANYEIALRRVLLGVMQGTSSMLAKDSSEENRSV